MGRSELGGVSGGEVKSRSPAFGLSPPPLSSVNALSETAEALEACVASLPLPLRCKADVSADDLLVACGGERDG